MRCSVLRNQSLCSFEDVYLFTEHHVLELIRRQVIRSNTNNSGKRIKFLWETAKHMVNQIAIIDKVTILKSLKIVGNNFVTFDYCLQLHF